MPLQLASDNFNRSLENPLSDGGNWLVSTGGHTLEIATMGQVNCPDLSGITDYNYFNGGISWPNDQYSQASVLLNAVKGNTFGGVMVRNSATAASFYNAAIGNNVTTLSKVVTGTFTSLASASWTWHAGDVLNLTVASTTLTSSINGSQQLTHTDSALTSGFPALYAQTNTGTDGGTINNIAMSAWSGGAADLSLYNTQTWVISV